jgi:hypothetical protein
MALYTFIDIVSCYIGGLDGKKSFSTTPLNQIITDQYGLKEDASATSTIYGSSLLPMVPIVATA